MKVDRFWKDGRLFLKGYGVGGWFFYRKLEKIMYQSETVISGNVGLIVQNVWNHCSGEK